MERYICIHGHFYQPPRENPWLEQIELQDSAYPFHDWNERITKECYAPNGAARILDDQNRIIEIVNNYARISFNIGPTLLSWMEEQTPAAYQAILRADRESISHFSGHGSAMAQVYNHMIMPLANQRDKETQVRWGIADFESRFGRKPEGIWLAETAADTPTLEVLAEHGIVFTVLSPYQAARFRRIGDHDWHDATGARIDPTTPYIQRLPSGRSIALFFYDGPISQGVAFEGLLRRGENLANRLMGAFYGGRDWPQIVHIATDGETYGHHHRYGEMALAYALNYIDSSDGVRLTNYGEFLERHPPMHEAEIIENTSWSCYHGVERWRGDCGCNSGGHPNWNQAWRSPLRKALDWLRDELIPLFERDGGKLFRDPWAARDAYIAIILDRSPECVEQFFAQHAARALSPEEKTRALKLLEMQRHAMLMYTSCGWFFDDIAGIETVQVIQYAGRVIQLAEELFAEEFEPTFLGLLKRARSNVHSKGNGQTIYERSVRPSIIDLERVTAHYAVSALFERYDEQIRIYRFLINLQQGQLFESGRTRLFVGQAQITSEITLESDQMTFCVLHFGDQNLNGGVRRFISTPAYQSFASDVAHAFKATNLPEVIRILDRDFQGLTYSLRSLFRDEQRAVLNQILDTTLRETESTYRHLYNQNSSLIGFLRDLGIPLPRGFHTAVEFVLNADLRTALEAETLDLNRVQAILDEAQNTEVEIDTAGLNFVLQSSMERLFTIFYEYPTDIPRLETLNGLVALGRTPPFDIDFWQVQNIFYTMRQTVYPLFQAQAERNENNAHAWLQQFEQLGEQLGVLINH
jgi:alpha-amylase/alpha-mannosidase (GH57 family)